MNYPQLNTLVFMDDNIIKFEFERVDNAQDWELEFYDSENRIPLSIKRVKNSNLSDTYYSENSYNENFIEFWFNGERELDEIFLISTEIVTIETQFEKTYLKENRGFYKCKIISLNRIDMSVPMKYIRGKDFIEVLFEHRYEECIYYAVGENFQIAVGPNDELVSLLLTNLSSKEISSVFGF